MVVKEFKVSELYEHLIRDFCQKVSILLYLNHSCTTETILHLLQTLYREFMPTGNLQDVLDHFRQPRESKLPLYGSKLSIHLLIKIALDISRALVYLEDQNPPILHNDLKPDNIMIQSPQ